MIGHETEREPGEVWPPGINQPLPVRRSQTPGDRLWSYVIVWGIVASGVEIVAESLIEGGLPWTGRVADNSLGGEPVAALLFLLRMAFETVTAGLLNVSLSLFVFHWCLRTQANRWAQFAVVVGNILVSAWILWVFIETWNDHGYIESVEMRVSEALPLMAALLVTGIFVAIREGSAEPIPARTREATEPKDQP